jgi:hypothetical protein
MSYKPIAYAVDKTIKYIDGRRKGEIKSLKTSHKKLNSVTLQGFEWNKVITLGGLSGSGKSMILEQWKRDFVDYNPNEKFYVLSFEFEMLARDQIARSLSGKLNMNTRHLYSAESETQRLTETEFVQVCNTIRDISNYPFYYVERVHSVDEIERIINSFIKDKNLFDGESGLIVTLDHVLLTKNKTGESERQTLSNLYSMAIQMKQYCEDVGVKILFIFASQLNRDILEGERVLNSKLHYPSSKDLFGSSSLFNGSDYVIVSHRPSSITGMPKYYGLPIGDYKEGLPVYCPEDESRSMIYWHVLKNRGGEAATLMMVEDFKHSRVVDYEPEKLNKEQINGKN